MGDQVIQRGGAVGQLIGNVCRPVVHAVLQQHHIVAFLQEHGGEPTVVLALSRHIESSVNVDENGILAFLPGRIIDIDDLGGRTVIDIRDIEPFLQRIGIRGFRRHLVGPRYEHLQHRARDFEAASAEPQHQGGCSNGDDKTFHGPNVRILCGIAK